MPSVCLPEGFTVSGISAPANPRSEKITPRSPSSSPARLYDEDLGLLGVGTVYGAGTASLRCPSAVSKSL